MPFSTQIHGLLEDYQDRPLPLGVLLHRAGDQGFGLLSTVLSLPFLIFIPPGLSTMVALVVAMLGWQMGLGLSEPWLPPQVRSLGIISPSTPWGSQKSHPTLASPRANFTSPLVRL